MNTKQRELSIARSIFLVVIASIGSWAVYSLNHLRKVFYNDFLTGFGVTNAQLGDLVSLWSLVCVICYIPGGILGDKVRMKYLAPISFFCTAAILFWCSTTPSYETLRVIYILYGAVCGLLFWSCRYKIIKLASNDEKTYNRNIGLSYSLFAICGLVLSAVLIAIFAKTTSGMGMVSLFWIVGGINVVLGILGFLFIPKFPDEIKEEKNKIRIWNLSNLLTAIKNPGVILSSIALFLIYTPYTLQYVYTSYLTDVFLASAVLVGLVSSIRTYGINIVAAPVLGFLGKKFSGVKVLFYVSIIMVILPLIFIFLPEKSSLAVVAMIVIIIYAFFMNGSYSIASALLPECNIPTNIFATAVGIFSFVGFAPDIIFAPIIGRILDSQGTAAYHTINWIFVACAVACVAVLYIIMKYITKKKDTATE